MMPELRRAFVGAALLTTLVASTSLVAANAANAANAAPARPAVAASHTANCYGYTGTFKDGAHTVEHAVGWSECFGIAPDRTIWHAWPSSNGWKRMPNNGLGDYVSYAGLGPSQKHSVCVAVTPSSEPASEWQSTLWSTGWSTWTRGCVYPH